MPTGHNEMHGRQLFALVIHVIVCTFYAVTDIFRIIIAIFRQSVGNIIALRFFRQAAHLCVIQAQHGSAAFFHMRKIFFEGLINVFFRPVVVQMIVFNIGNDRNKR